MIIKEPHYEPTETTEIYADKKEEFIGLKGKLKAFELTPLAPLIRSTLEYAGINPVHYRINEFGHANYHGLPATEPQGDEVVSPIVEGIYKGMQAGQIVTEPITDKDVAFTDDPDLLDSNPNLLNKLFPLNVEGIYDVESGETLAYAVPTSADGGREGYAILSTKHVILSPAANQQ